MQICIKIRNNSRTLSLGLLGLSTSRTNVEQSKNCLTEVPHSSIQTLIPLKGSWWTPSLPMDGRFVKQICFQCASARFGGLRYMAQQYFCHQIVIVLMEQEVNQPVLQKPQLMEQEYTDAKSDLFQKFLIQSLGNNSMQIEKIQKPIHSRSSKTLNRRSDFRKILNSSSSNDRLIPSSIKNDTSRQNSEGGEMKYQTQNSVDSESFRKSFKKKFQESFSVSHTIRDSSSSFSQRSDRSSRNIIIIPQVYKQEEQVLAQQKRLGCNCKRSRCLKLYCQCFQKQMYCNKSCNCHSCGNIQQNKQEHKQAIIEALARNAHTMTHGFQFEEKVESLNIPVNNAFSLGIQHEQVKKGCKCKKTKCLKKYCECYQSGVQCTIFCRCEGCYNKESGHQNGGSPMNNMMFLTKNI